MDFLKGGDPELRVVTFITIILAFESLRQKDRW